MEVSNYYTTAKLWGTSDKKVSKSSEKNKWKLTDSLKEKIVELAKKDAQDNVYMGNAFMNLRKMEVSKVAPNRAARGYRCWYSWGGPPYPGWPDSPSIPASAAG